MTIAQQRCTCGGCSHVFDAEVVVNAPIDVTIASMQAIRCPSCGSDNCGIGGAHKDAPSASAPVEERACWWKQRGDHGTSSLTVYCAFSGGYSPHGRFDIPYDPDDYSRCRKLLDLIPEWRTNLSVVVARFPWYRPFIDRWDEFDRLWDEESSSGRCPKLYALMLEACQESEQLR